MTIDSAKAAPPPPSKDNPKFWSKKIKRRMTAGCEASNFSVRIRHKGHREWFNLDTGNRELAAKKAAEIYRRVVAGGWEQALLEYKGRGIGTPEDPAPKTVGEFIRLMEKCSGLSAATLAAYTSKTRTVVSQIMELKGGKSKHDHYRRKSGEKTGNELWRVQVDAVLLADLTAARITRWRERTLASVRNDPLKQEATRNTIVSSLRSARSFFAESNTTGLAHQPASPRPFSGFKIGTLQIRRYKSSFSAAAVMEAAKAEFYPDDADSYVILLLAVLAGLRRGEIDRLQWSHVDFVQGVVWVQSSESGRVKTSNSEDSVEVSEELLAVLREVKDRRQGVFVVAPGKLPRNGFRANWRYRCQFEFTRVLRWLGAQGVKGRNRLHILRKEYGSVINREHGIHAASVSLRHRDISLTAKYYADRRLKVKISLADLQ